MNSTDSAPDLDTLTSTLASLAQHLTDVATTAQASTTHPGGPTDPPLSNRVRERSAIRAAAAILSATDRLMAAVVGLLSHTTHRGIIAEEGVTTSTWLRVFAARTVGDEKMLTATVERLADMPAVSAWFADGTISWPTVRGIVAATRNLTGDQRRWLDDTLAADRDRVCRLDADQVVAAADRLADQARPDLHADRERRQFHRQRFAVHPRLDGTSHVTGEFDAEATATLLAGLDTTTDADGHAHDDGDDADSGDDVDWRVLRGRSNAATLIAIVEGHLAGGRGGRARPSMLVITDATTLARDTTADTLAAGTASSAAGDADTTDVRPDGWSSTAQLLWNTHRPPVELTAAAAQRLACDATVRHILVDGDGQVLGATAVHPAVSTTLRAALVVRDGGCRFPGCVAPVDRCDTHHVIRVAHGGKTVLDNLALICGNHHHAIHDSGWANTLHADGSMTFTRRGVTITSQPRAAQRVTSTDPPPAGRPARRRSPATHITPPPAPGHAEHDIPRCLGSDSEYDQRDPVLVPF